MPEPFSCKKSINGSGFPNASTNVSAILVIPVTSSISSETSSNSEHTPFAYVLLETLRRTTLVGTEMETAQCGTIRAKLFKIAAVVKVSVRRIKFALPSHCPVQKLWTLVFDRLNTGLPLPAG